MKSRGTGGDESEDLREGVSGTTGPGRPRRQPASFIATVAFIAVALVSTTTLIILSSCAETLARKPFCYGSSCNGESPDGTNCEADDSNNVLRLYTNPVKDSSGDEVGSISLMYSRRCRSNWGRLSLGQGKEVGGEDDVTIVVTAEEHPDSPPGADGSRHDRLEERAGVRGNLGRSPMVDSAFSRVCATVTGETSRYGRLEGSACYSIFLGGGGDR